MELLTLVGKNGGSIGIDVSIVVPLGKAGKVVELVTELVTVELVAIDVLAKMPSLRNCLKYDPLQSVCVGAARFKANGQRACILVPTLSSGGRRYRAGMVHGAKDEASDCVNEQVLCQKPQILIATPGGSIPSGRERARRERTC